MSTDPGASASACYTSLMTPPRTSPVSTMAFGPLQIGYDERVLEPRPWTLAQAQWAAALLEAAVAGPLLELCCGAGQIGLATMLLSGREAVLVDRSEAACELSERNAVDAGVAGRVEVRQGDLEEALAPTERFALVLADPPYIPSADTGTFPRDPLAAIDGGDDGLALARRCLQVAARHLHPGGPVLLQLRDLSQAERLTAELAHGPAVPLRYVDARTFADRGAVLHLERSA